MVWGLIEPGGRGDFFPGGTFTDWEPRLEKHFNEVLSDEDRKKLENRLAVYSHEVSRKFHLDLGPLEQHEIPREFMVGASYNSLASLIKTKDRLLAVDQKFKDIVESLEPGVHQFWPIQITMPKGRAYPEQYYGLVIGQFFDSFLQKQSPDECWRMFGNYEAARFTAADTTKSIVGQLAMNASVFGSAHLWREKMLKRPNIFFSDTLQHRLSEAGLRLPKRLALKEVAA